MKISLYISILFFYILPNIGLSADSLKINGIIRLPESAYIVDIEQDALGNIWLASSKGVFKYNGYEFSKLTSGNNSLNSLPCNNINSIVVDHDDLWIATDCGGFCQYNLIDNKFTCFNIDNNKLKDNRVKDILVTEDVVWLGFEHLGLGKYNKLTKEVSYKTPFIKSSNKEEKYSNNITTILADKFDDNILWVGTRFGLYKYNIKKDIFTFHNLYKERNYLKIDHVKSLFQGEMGVLWVGHWGGGLVKYNYTSKNKERFLYNKNQFKNQDYNIISDIINLSEEELLLSVSLNKTGAVVFNKKTGQFTDVGYTSNVFYTRHFNKTISTLKDNEGRFWFVGANQIGCTEPTSLKSSKNNGIFLTNIFVNGLAIDSFNTNYTSYLNLRSDHNNLSFSIAAIDYNLPHNITYQIKLDPVSKDWFDLEERRNIDYSLLKPGKYRFDYRALNKDKIVMHSKSLEINIIPFWYQTIWFKLLSILLIILSFVAFLRYHTYQKYQKEKLKATYDQKLIESELKALRAQMNPHFLFNSLNSIKYYILENENRKAADYLEEFSTLVRLILNVSSKDLISISTEIEALELYLRIEHMRLEKQFDYNITIDDNIDVDFEEIPPLLLQPFVENAIWHGIMPSDGKRKVDIVIRKLEDGLIFIIEDNGIGRVASKKNKILTKRKSKGISLTDDRMKLTSLANEFELTYKIIDLVEDDEPQGTRVEIYKTHKRDI